ncbi:MAG: hypothetical protein ABGX83_04185 [Nitrospira sp.]|nr:hypothetical protein [Candidatus Manganitrophaceae bacterium]HIL34716.1 hypothetical protein [Candidatus Manganitrophaceae bacterium]
MGIEIFGAIAVSSMVICYALEQKSHYFVLAFSISCLAAALYAFLIQSWPFAVIEMLWFLIAARRWTLLRRVEGREDK